MPAHIRARPYKELLTPLLHRRFIKAAALILALCYVETLIIGDKSSLFWSWFPLGLAGIRTLLLFISPFSIFVLRVAQLHCGTRSTVSPFQTVTRYLVRRETLQTFYCYIFSAWWFSEVYVWSVPATADLGMVAQGKSWERKRLNERALYLRSHCLMLAIVQTIIHLSYDNDSIRISTSVPSFSKHSYQRFQIELPPIQRVRLELPSMLRQIATLSLFMAFSGPIFYAMFLRRRAWTVSMALASTFMDVPRSGKLSYIPPYHITLVLRSLISGSLLLLLWRGSNVLFSVYVGQEPLKGGEPITNETKDPNGSLISGLKAKKQLPKSFAFCELSYISQQSKERRMSIFKDVDQPGSSVWTQILTECLKVVEDVPKRISNHQSAQKANSNPSDVNELQSLPRISTSLKEEQVIFRGASPSTRRERIESSLGTMAKSYGDRPVQASNGDPFSPKAKQYLALAQNKLLTHDQQQVMSQAGMKKVWNDYLEQILRSPLGEPFRQSFARRVATIAFGDPYTEVGLIVDAIDSLASFASSSLHEDRLGQVAKDVPLILRTFVRAYQTLSVFVSSLEVHWTDKSFQEEDRKSGDIGTVLGSLEDGLRVLVEGFGEFARDIGLEEKDLKAARTIAGLSGG